VILEVAVGTQTQGWWLKLQGSGLCTMLLLQQRLIEHHVHFAGPWPIFMMTRIARTPEDARLTLAAVMAVRASAARLKGDLRPLGGERLAVAFVRVGAELMGCVPMTTSRCPSLIPKGVPETGV
jgi:hypothetical protein